MIRTFVDLVEVAFLAQRIERLRKQVGPRELVCILRQRGARHEKRGEPARARLKRIIRLIDRFPASGPNCYRRALIEIAMDPAAATETLHMGFTAETDRVRGHAWLDSSPDKGPGYHAELTV